MNCIVVRGGYNKNTKFIKEAIQRCVPIAYVKSKPNGYTEIFYDTDSCFTKLINNYLPIDDLMDYLNEDDKFQKYLLMELLVEDVDVHIINKNKKNKFYNVVCGTHFPGCVVKNEHVNKAISIIDRIWYDIFGDKLKETFERYSL